MRVRFLNFELSNKIILHNYIRYSEGDVEWFPDDKALEYIQEKIVEAYKYPIPDAEIRLLHKDFIETSDFKRKVEILIYSYSNSIQRATLEDGTKIVFELNPESPEEWYCYNTHLIEYYKNKLPNCNIERLKKEFEKKQFNTPDPSRLIDSEFVRIKKSIDDDGRKRVSFWYNATYCGDIPKDEDGYKSFLSNQIKFGIEPFLQGNAYAEYEYFLKTVSQNATKDRDKNVKPKLFHEYLLTDKCEELAEQLKTKFNIERGKSIRLMIEVLIEMQLLVIENRGRNSLYNALKLYFNRNIGTYPSIFDYKLNSISDKEEIKSVKTKINFILKNLK